MNVLVLQHVAREGSAAIGDALRARGVGERIVRVDLGDAVPAGPGDAAGLLVMGGPMGVYEAERFPHLRSEVALIGQAVAHGLPVLGVCLGSQLVAAALGARVARAPAREIGFRPVALAQAAGDDALLRGCPESFAPLSWHGDAFELPPGAVSLASSRATAHQAFRHGRTTWGLLFHLEMDAAHVEAMCDDFPGELTEAGVAREALIAEAPERLAGVAPLARDVFGAFADVVVREVAARRAAPPA